MLTRLLCSMIVFITIAGNSFSQSARREIAPEKYHLVLPQEWKKPKLIEAITTILPETISELKDLMFCLDCKAAYTVRLVIEEPEVLSEHIQDERVVRKKISYLYSQNYRFRAVLGIYDSIENAVVELLLVDPETTQTFRKEFTVPSTLSVDRIENQDGQVIKSRISREERISPSNYVADHKEDFRPTIHDLMAIAEKKVYEINALIKKLN